MGQASSCKPAKICAIKIGGKIQIVGTLYKLISKKGSAEGSHRKWIKQSPLAVIRALDSLLIKSIIELK